METMNTPVAPYSNTTTLATSFPPTGYWGPPTSSVDWCENNYDISYYVAEFFNSLSSIAMILVGIVGVYLHVSFEKRFLLTFGSIAIVGLGSIAFHGTLLFPLQMLDEVPMVYSILALAYCCIENRSYRRYGVWFPVSIALYGLLTTVVLVGAGPHDLMLAFVVFQSSFAFMVLVVMSHIVKIYADIQDVKIRQMWKTTGTIALTAYVFWNIDYRLCDVMQNLPFGLGNPQLHAFWHLGASVGSYLVTLLVCYNRAENLGQSPMMEWKWGLVPYVVVNVKHSKST